MKESNGQGRVDVGRGREEWQRPSPRRRGDAKASASLNTRFWLAGNRFRTSYNIYKSIPEQDK